MEKTILSHSDVKFALFPERSYLLYYNLLPTRAEERHKRVNCVSKDTVKNSRQKIFLEIAAPDFYMPRGAKARKGSY